MAAEPLLGGALPWEDSTAVLAAAARSQRTQRLQQPDHAALTPLGTLDTLPPAKHPSLRAVLAGSIESARPVSKKLLFVYVRCAETGRLWECIAKLADGLLCVLDISQLGAAAAAGVAEQGGCRCALVGWPERSANGVLSLHVVSIELLGADGAPTLALPSGAAAVAGLATSAAAVPAAVGGATAAAVAAVPRNRFHSSGYRVRPANSNRFMVLAQWLVDTFGRETLVRDGGVLDVAGGAGGVAFGQTTTIPTTTQFPG